MGALTDLWWCLRLGVVLPDVSHDAIEVGPLSPVVVPTLPHQLQHGGLKVLRFVEVRFTAPPAMYTLDDV